jgi:hypothetical protein
MVDPEYSKLEFDVDPSVGSAQVDSVFEWAKNENPALVRCIDGTEQIRLRNESNCQTLLIRPDAEHAGNENWHSTVLDKGVYLRTSSTEPGNPWVLSWGDGEGVSVDFLNLIYIEDVGFLIEATADEENGVGTLPLPESIKERVDKIFEGELRATPWE